MIRQATIDDLKRLEPLAVEFVASSKHLRPLNLAHFVESWTSLLDSGRGVIFLLVDEAGAIEGTIGGVMVPDLISGALVASEFHWFVSKTARGSGGVRLYRAFEEWAISAGCSEIHMVHLSDSMPDKLRHFYLRNGFKPAETRYVKRFDQQEAA